MAVKKQEALQSSTESIFCLPDIRHQLTRREREQRQDMFIWDHLTKFIRNKSSIIRTQQFCHTGGSIPVDTGRKLNVHKTFTLRPVSTGIKCKTMLSGNNKNEQVTPGNKILVQVLVIVQDFPVKIYFPITL